MRRLLIKCLCLLALFTVFQVGLNELILGRLPFHWGHAYLHARMSHMKAQKEPYEVVALGSSRVMCHLDPELLSELLGGKEKAINCGLAGTFPPLTYRFYEQMLADEAFRPNVVVLELDWLMQPSGPDIHVTDYKYPYNFSEYSFAMRTTWAQPNLRRTRKLMAMWGYSLSYLEKLWNVGLFQSAYEVQQQGPDSTLMGLAGNGFINLEDAVLYAPDPEIRQGMAALRDTFLADTLVLRNARQQALRYFTAPDRAQNPINSLHMKRINRLLALSEAKGIHLVFLISPRVYAPDLLAMYEALPPSHRMELSDPRRFPSFYQTRYSFDDMHLNHEGAVQYTRAFALAIQKIMEP